MLSDAALAAVVAMAERHQTRPEYLLAVWNSESGLNPKAVNPKGGAAGLNQSMPDTLKSYGMSEADVAAYPTWSAERQLPWIEKQLAVVTKYAGHGMADAMEYYAANFWMPALKRWAGASTEIVRKGDHTKYGKVTPDMAYKANQGFDAEGKGYITAADLQRYIDKSAGNPVYKDALRRLGVAPSLPDRGNIPVLPGGGGGLARAGRPGIAAGVVVLAAVAYVAWKSGYVR